MQNGSFEETAGCGEQSRPPRALLPTCVGCCWRATGTMAIPISISIPISMSIHVHACSSPSCHPRPGRAPTRRTAAGGRPRPRGTASFSTPALSLPEEKLTPFPHFSSWERTNSDRPTRRLPRSGRPTAAACMHRSQRVSLSVARVLGAARPQRLAPTERAHGPEPLRTTPLYASLTGHECCLRRHHIRSAKTKTMLTTLRLTTV
jgi:hypothetical protein